MLRTWAVAAGGGGAALALPGTPLLALPPPPSLLDAACSPSTAQCLQVILGGQYVNNPKLSDVTFIVEGRPFHAHRIALLASSEIFKTMFDGAAGSRAFTCACCLTVCPLAHLLLCLPGCPA